MLGPKSVSGIFLSLLAPPAFIGSFGFIEMMMGVAPFCAMITAGLVGSMSVGDVEFGCDLRLELHAVLRLLSELKGLKCGVMVL